ncbi:hypothetical protein GCM10010112_83000 [Actinoplanes lobatus]|uniref:PrgI family protein n=1 Tax=Actinoplanes lobatus TaxID=113568 RepID=A0A7W7HLP6_9ACTN|nr:PrgI family protein [Actinoplanes lobatus]MBB4752512.1 hypothetical protein [Actinoplanes lobatus]GGN94057.1 hypothetical protein GCM10010112_83000 [Actinoplanes lobatus]GIE44812.1 hypothetical protein Alo02nite_77100 [Actinoplanes lobatus]
MDDDLPRVQVPADIGTPDTIAWGLTFRQLAILAAVSGAGWLAYSRFGPLLPAAAWLAAALPVTAVTAVVALGRRDGLPLDVWLRHAFTLHRTPRVQTPGETGARLADTTGPLRTPAPLRSPATTITGDGTLTVDQAVRAVIGCGTVNIGLCTGTEQQALLAGFGAWLNALNGPAQIVVAAHRHDLTPHATAVATAALPHERLRQAAADYAAFLTDLDADREPLRRQVLAVVPAGPAADTTLRAFGGLGVTATRLDGGQVTAALAAAADPFDPPVAGPRAVPGTPITARS